MLALLKNTMWVAGGGRVDVEAACVVGHKHKSLVDLARPGVWMNVHLCGHTHNMPQQGHTPSAAAMFHITQSPSNRGPWPHAKCAACGGVKHGHEGSNCPSHHAFQRFMFSSATDLGPICQLPRPHGHANGFSVGNPTAAVMRRTCLFCLQSRSISHVSGTVLRTRMGGTRSGHAGEMTWPLRLGCETPCLRSSRAGARNCCNCSLVGTPSTCTWYVRSCPRSGSKSWV